MTLNVQLPPDIEALLRQMPTDPGETLKASALVDLYRRGLITHHQLGEAMGLSRFETDGLLKHHGVYFEMDADEIEAEADSIIRGMRP